MNEQEYLHYNRSLMAEFTTTLATRTAQMPGDSPLRELAEAFRRLDDNNLDFYVEGARLVTRLFDTYPEFAPTFPRQLLWFLGGDCLHYMADDEIAEYQQLEELRTIAANNGETLNMQEARAKLLNLQ